MEKKYIAVQYSAETQRKMRDWCKVNGFPLIVGFGGETQDESDFDFHTTIFFSTSKHVIANQTMKTVPQIVRPVGFELLGPENDIPVLKVESEGIAFLRKTYETKFNMKDAWPEYKPHISLSYARSKDYQVAELPSFDLIYDEIKIATAKEF